MKRNVYLQGELGDRFGQKFVINSTTCTDILKCISANRPEFRNYLIQCHDKGMDADIKIHDKSIEKADDLRIPLKEGDVTITILPAGSKKAGEKILGAILLVLAFFYPPTAQFLLTSGGALTLPGSIVAGMAANLAIMGLSQLMADDPEGDGAPENYLYEGDAHVIDEGDPVPLLYGRLLVTGTPIAFNTTNGKLDNLGSTIEADGGIYRHHVGIG